MLEISRPEIANQKLQDVLNEKFNLPAFRKGQEEIISHVLRGQDVLAVLPTGGGKSLCYQLPAVVMNSLVVVVSPLIALMRDQVLSLKRKGIAAGCRHSGQSNEEILQLFADMGQGQGFVLYLSPERVQDPRFQAWLSRQKIGLFAVDEAHCVSQWGHDFREEYAQLSVLKRLRPDVPVLALTASATPTVLTDIAKQLKLNSPIKLVHGFYRPNLYYQVEFCLDDETKQNFVQQAIRKFPSGRVLIYGGTRKIVEELAFDLKTKFANVGFYHAGLSSEQRTFVQNEYVNGKIRILVATNAFGMGIDQPDVRLVMHYQLPSNIDSLYQEMGRAGRDEKPSTCVLLFSKKDKGLQSYFIESGSDAPEIRNLRWRNLEALSEYAEGSECRHREILTYYRDSQRIKVCGHCDVCDPASDRRVPRPVLVPKVILKTSSSKKSAKRNPFASEVLDSEQEVRFQALREWRRVKAEQQDVPAFVVFGDKTLRQLAIQCPGTLNELRGIYGIGEAKLEIYGADLLACMAEF